MRIHVVMLMIDLIISNIKQRCDLCLQKLVGLRSYQFVGHISFNRSMCITKIYQLMTYQHQGSNVTKHLRRGSGSGSLGILHARSRLHTNTLLGQQVHQQRTRAAITLRVEGRLVVLVLLHAIQVDVEEVRRVERTSLSLRVELGAEDRARLVDQS